MGIGRVLKGASKKLPKSSVKRKSTFKALDSKIRKQRRAVDKIEHGLNTNRFNPVDRVGESQLKKAEEKLKSLRRLMKDVRKKGKK